MLLGDVERNHELSSLKLGFLGLCALLDLPRLLDQRFKDGCAGVSHFVNSLRKVHRVLIGMI